MAERTDRKRLIEYLPNLMQQFSEIKELMRVANIETDEIYARIEKTLDESFIDDCSVYGVEKYEKLLGIAAIPGESLDFRKNRVRAYWGLDGQYSYKRFVQSLNTLLDGSWNYDMICDSEHYRMTFHVYKDEHLNMLDEFFQRVLPINVFYDVHVTKDWSGSHYVGIVWQDDEIMEWR